MYIILQKDTVKSLLTNNNRLLKKTLHTNRTYLLYLYNTNCNTIKSQSVLLHS